MSDAKTILVGVSDIFFYTKIRDAFLPHGYTLQRIKNQDDWFEKLGSVNPHAVILNMNDDRLDASSILQRLKGAELYNHIPVLAFANHEEVETWKHAKELGIDKIVSRNEFSARTLALLEENDNQRMKQSSLHSQHETLGAHFSSIGEWEMPEHYGQAIEEHMAIRQNVGVADLSHRGLNRLTGEDRVSWLQNLISNDIRLLTPGHGLHSAFMDHKGKMLAYFRVLLMEDSILLEDIGEVGDATYQHLKKFLLFGTKAKLESYLESWSILLLAGPSAPALIREAFSVPMEEAKPLTVQTGDINGKTVLFLKAEETGEQDIEILVPNTEVVNVWDRVWSVGQKFSLQAVGHQALESLRLEAGIPKVGPDINDRIVPPEANLEGKAFSLSKGCYPGQEVVARMDTYGSVKRRLVGLLLDLPDNHLPEPGAKLFSGDREVGWLSSVAYSPILKKPLAFGFPLRDFTTPQTELTVEIQGKRHAAIVESLPFPLPDVK